MGTAEKQQICGRSRDAYARGEEKQRTTEFWNSMEGSGRKDKTSSTIELMRMKHDETKTEERKERNKKKNGRTTTSPDWSTPS